MELSGDRKMPSLADQVNAISNKENSLSTTVKAAKDKKELLEIEEVLEIAKSIEAESSTSYVQAQKWISLWTEMCLQVLDCFNSRKKISYIFQNSSI